MAIRAPDGANKIHMQSQRRKSNNGEYSNNPLQSDFGIELVLEASFVILSIATRFWFAFHFYLK